jgi:hypothetical protein
MDSVEYLYPARFLGWSQKNVVYVIPISDVLEPFAFYQS